MITARESIKQVIFERVLAINGFETEEALVSMITEEIKKDVKVNKLFEQAGILAYEIPAIKDEEAIESKGVYLYCNNSLLDWTYERYETIADAIREAVKYFDAYIICNGEIIDYDALDDNTAYYYDNNCMKLVNI